MGWVGLGHRKYTYGQLCSAMVLSSWLKATARVHLVHLMSADLSVMGSSLKATDDYNAPL